MSRQPSHEELNQLFITAGEDYQIGLLGSAKAAYLRLLEYFSDAAVLHYNLGLVYYEQEEYESSRISFARAADLSPEDMDILFNLGLTQKKTGDLEGAIASYVRILETDPKSIDTLYNLGGCYKDSGQHAEAIKTYLDVLQIAPDYLSANNNLAFVYQLIGEREQAVYYYQKVLEYKPDHQAAIHMLAALTGAEVASPPESYVRDVFDNYSPYYEQSLVVELEYNVPTSLRELIDCRSDLEKAYDHGLDIGCGTGLGGQAFTDLVSVLDGIDLSEKMIEVAGTKQIYHNLYVANTLDFLNSSIESYDFYLAADVFAYVGDLAETFSLLRKRARRNVLFCFSTEAVDGSYFKLQPTGRFAHAPNYIKEVAESTGWKVVTSHRNSIRKERGSWVPGDLWLLGLPDNF
jgi:predicted TPR repeat methyltransferase